VPVSDRSTSHIDGAASSIGCEQINYLDATAEFGA
jgi:hypothetical protein